MANKSETVYLRGKLFWAKVLPKQLHDNYNKDGKQWAFDLSLDADGLKQVKQHKELTVKDKDDDRGKFLTFKQKELRANGDPNQPIRIKDAAGNAWDDDKQIGNGTVADVRFEIRDFGAGKYAGIYPRAIRVLDLVPYESQEFAPLDENDEYASAAKELSRESPDFEKDFGLDGRDLDDDLDDVI